MDRIQISLYGIKIVGLTLILVSAFLLILSKNTRKRVEVLTYSIIAIILVGLIGWEIFCSTEYNMFGSLIVLISGLMVFLLTYYRERNWKILEYNKKALESFSRAFLLFKNRF